MRRKTGSFACPLPALTFSFHLRHHPPCLFQFRPLLLLPISIVLAFGVAVNAKKDRFFCLPLACIDFLISSSASSSMPVSVSSSSASSDLNRLGFRSGCECEERQVLLLAPCLH